MEQALFQSGFTQARGTSPGLTEPVTGTYNSKTHAFLLTRASAVVGGPFNGFTGYWHLQGHVYTGQEIVSCRNRPLGASEGVATVYDSVRSTPKTWS